MGGGKHFLIGSTAVNDAFSDAESSLISDQDESSDDSDEPLSPMKQFANRRRRDDDNVSLAASLKDLETAVALSPQVSMDLCKTANNEVSEISVANYFADPEPLAREIHMTDEVFVTVAQIVTEQAISGSLSTLR